MMMFARHAIAKVVGTAMAVAALGLIAPDAAADSGDDAFLRAVYDHGVNFGSPADLVERATHVCAMFSGGMSPEKVLATMEDSFKTTWTPRQDALFMADAVQAYCPRYADLFIH